MEATITVSLSSHPDFELFATTTIKGRQAAKRGNRAEITEWIEALVESGKKHNVTFSIVDETN